MNLQLVSIELAEDSYLRVKAKLGCKLDHCVREAIILALANKRNVVLCHNDHEYKVHITLEGRFCSVSVEEQKVAAL